MAAMRLNIPVMVGSVGLYEGPRGGPGRQEMLHPASYLKPKGLDKARALVTNGRFSGASSGLSTDHTSPEAAAGGAIALVEHGDTIRIDTSARTIHALVSPEQLFLRREAMQPCDNPWRAAEQR